MPSNFVVSFMEERWSQARTNLPSSEFKAQIDPKTMLWKDLRKVNESIDLRHVDGNTFKPKLRPMETKFGVAITINKAEGVPLP